MRRILLGLLVLGGFAAFSAPSQAQIPNNLNDPFYQYFSFFLPRQAAIASQPRVNDSINAAAAARSEVSAIDRSALYNPISPYGLEGLDPSQGGVQRQSRASRGAGTFTSTNTRGQGASGYFNRTNAFHPTLRNAPARYSAPRRGGGGGGMGGMGGMGGGGMPNPGGGMGMGR